MNRSAFFLFAIFLTAALAAHLPAADLVKTENGAIEGATPATPGVRTFKGIPFAQPPVGDLRWREPLPVKNWTGVRTAGQFGPRCMQRTAPNADYWFRSNGMSEDCLYLNVWTPAKSDKERLPVLVYIFGGGFQNGDGSEPRYDGEAMARKGIVAVTVNYRTNIFGFFSHPELTKESPHHASGNYGLLDQVAALQWVKRNIAAFGGDPQHVTIAGESAGSVAVSALMASPLSRHLIAGAIGESGAMFSTLPPRPLAQSEQDGADFAASAGAASLVALRAMSAVEIQDALAKTHGMRFNTNLDGYFLSKPLAAYYEAAEQAKVPLLAGSNSQEQPARAILGAADPTPENFASAVIKLYGDQAGAVLKVYAPSAPDQVMEAATHLASARFTGHSTWKWTELQMKTGERPVYRYFYAHPRPRFLNPPAEGAGVPPAPAAEAIAPPGAVHSAEIQYCMGNLDLDKRYAWEPADYKVSEIMQAYFANFIKTGNPNGKGLTDWPAYRADAHFERLWLDVTPRAEPEPYRDRYLALDAVNAK
jgi:para-nitrobenzyl esterase